MNRSSRFKQDAVIVMAILVVIIALWKLHTRPQYYGRLGSWAETNIFGASTLGLMSEAGGRNGEGQPLAPITPNSGASNQSLNAESNALASASTTNAAGRQTNVIAAESVSTNLQNTNGPITVIGVTPAELADPIGVATSANVPEAAAIEKRLGEVSAKGGDIQISLSWQNENDLDLHCIDPSGEEIFFSNRRGRNTGGELDVDQNAHLPYNSKPVENIYWPVNGAPAGLYRIFVVYYAQHSDIDATPFLVRTVVQGSTNFFRATIRNSVIRERKLICNLHYDPANPDPARRFRFGQ